MEPYSPAFRRALREAHPGLREVDIDRLEALTTQRGALAPNGDAHRRALLDDQIQALIRERMPRFRDVARTYAAIEHASRAARAHPRIRIEPKG